MGAGIARKRSAESGAAGGRTLQERGARVLAIHERDRFEGNTLGAHRLAFADVGARAKQLVVHLVHHTLGSFEALGLALRQMTEMGDFGTGEQRRRGVGTSGDAGARRRAWRRGRTSVRCIEKAMRRFMVCAPVI